MPTKVWMKVDKENCELPLAVADSCAELAELVGMPKEQIRTAVWKYDHGVYAKTPFRCVIIDDEEDEE